MLRYRSASRHFLAYDVVWGQAPEAADAERLNRLESRLQVIEAQLNPSDGNDASGVVEPMAIQPAAGIFELPEGFERVDLQSVRDPSITEGIGDDSDLDGLTNQQEALIGSDASNPDTDGDALLDGWEVHGVNGLDLRAMGASPLHKDIFVEMDFMSRPTATNGLQPNAAAIAAIKSTFNSAPVSNPDGSMGIRIHLEVGDQVPYDEDLNPYAQELFAIKNAHFDAARVPVFHYMVWANGYGGGSSSGVSMSIPHSDFIVTLGRWNNGAGGTENEKIGTFIHELGHNLGLTHGGAGDHANFKPNHISVMNYSFQTTGIRVFGTRRFDYQRFSLPTLRERFLAETVGLAGGSQLAGYWTRIAPAREVQADGAIDWNNNGVVDQTTIVYDINGDNFLGDVSSTPNQWGAIVYNGGSIGSTSSLENALESAQTDFDPFPYVELTEEMDQQLRP